ncbi:HAD family hydrolase [Cerasicoccus arenae]|uniref:Phosphoglycolate phosphatase n=1 Tax=Cerasicoccus arenae TaxID=424488 RepID=A0A8J3D9V9_9BACT|nr:HAD family phosphatase [Cerasicoccus arenae]MBK1859029.1 HAD family phosphatase [Cerasicoccus arenae]GHB94822.1 phosphoglycolate phosphatase [Cerasicoccus arenae]
MQLNQRFQAAIFDMDGLLLDTERLAYESYRFVCEELGLSDLDSVFYQCIGINSEAGRLVLKNGLDGIADHEIFCERWDEEYQKLTLDRPLPLKMGVVELLDYLSALAVPTAVATSTRTERALSKLGHSGIRDYFQVVIGGDVVERSKPAPDIYLAAATALKVDPTDCVAFEDSTNGVKAAVAAQMTVVQIPDLVAPSDELKQLGHIILSSLASVPRYEFA